MNMINPIPMRTPGPQARACALAHVLPQRAHGRGAFHGGRAQAVVASSLST